MENKNQLLSVVIPVYNEGLAIFSNMERVVAILEQASIPYELILVDDGSRDNTWLELERLTQTNSHVRAVQLSRNFGKEAALCAGLDHVTGDCCLIMDSDLQHPPQIIPEMYRLWKDEGFIVVEGVKQSRGKESFLYSLGAKSFYNILRKSSGIDLRNASDFRLLDKKALAAWRTLPEKQTFFRGMSSWIGFKRTQVPFTVAPREVGLTKWSFFRLTRLAINAITSYSAAPLYIAAGVGVFFLFLFVLMFAQTMYMKFFGHASDGFTTVIILQLVIGGVLMLSVGVIGLYLEKIYEEIKGRPRYLVQNVSGKPMQQES